ncbi:MAG: hypothetical protein IJA32_04950 [Lachnospiraceae bacterium]|nr:hypothetical protein [Lachnospiraceae bacterium]
MEDMCKYIGLVEKMLTLVEGQHEVTVYTNSKMITHMDGIFLPDLSQTVIEEYRKERVTNK